MARLALAVEERKLLGPGRVSFLISSRAAQLAHRAFRESVVVYRRAPEAVLFIGSGRVIGLMAGAPGFEDLHLVEYLDFAAPVPSEAESEVRDPGVRRSLSLDEQRFEEILQLAATGTIDAQALAETQALFAHDRQSGLKAYLKLHDRVLQRWRYRCAFTGMQFGPSPTRPHPALGVVAIRPRELGGALHVRNYLPMVAAAEFAWTHGHLALGSEFGVLVAERLIDPELHERLLPLGRLDLPSEPSLWPDSASVAYHRANIFDGDY
ncbi:MAG: hypothetical protein IPK28_18245 [Devosia sp.]|nr:hypothetical protein [Devosia sp.]